MPEYPDNEFTRMIEMTRAENAGSRPGVASATPMPTVRSADLGREVVDPPPLSPAEIEERNRLAREAGVVDPRIGPTETPGPYASLEEAVAVGAPVPMTAREFIGAQKQAPLDVRELYMRPGRVIGLGPVSRMPDFRNVEFIDLKLGVVRIDGMEFAMPRGDVIEYKQYVIAIARQAIMDQLEEAEVLLTAPDMAEAVDEGGAASAVETVQQQPEGNREEPTS